MEKLLQETVEEIYTEVVTHESQFNYKRRHIEGTLRPLFDKLARYEKALEEISEIGDSEISSGTLAKDLAIKTFNS